MNMRRARLQISGRVQGVGFRHHARQYALTQGVTGWVRNRPDGGVEAEVEGEEQAVRAVVDWCRQGPPAARVNGLLVDWEDYRGEFTEFSIRL